MADTKTILLALLGLAGAGYAVFEYDKQHKGQQARNMHVKITGVFVQDNDIVMNVKILNPNSQDMQIQSFVGNMLVDNKRVAEIKMFGDYTAKGNNEISIPLIMKPILPNMIMQVMQFVRNKINKIAFVGTINVNNNAIPLTLSYNK